MAGMWQEAIVRVLRSDDASVAGTGLLVATPQEGPCLLTCAHVVNEALGFHQYASARPDDPDMVIRFDLPTKAERRFEARVIEWAQPRSVTARVQEPVSDIALLKITSELPGDLRMHKPGDFDQRDLEDRQFHSFGFSRPVGAFAAGELRGSDTAGWLHVVGTGHHDDFIAPGFSGAPVYDETRRRILGMVVSVDASDGKRVAFAQSARVLWQGCPQLAHPYRGLRAFQESDAPFLFGREDFVHTALDKATRHPLLGVTAASGSGKSSAIRAGLLPALRRRDDLLIITMRPAGDPWKQLARGLAPLLYPNADLGDRVLNAEKIRGKLKSTPDYLRDCASGLLEERQAKRLVIFVDQFEELFTQAGHDRAEEEDDKGGDPDQESLPRPREDFRNLMVATAELDGSVQVQWIYALRGDFAGRAFRHPGFVKLLGDGDIKLPDMGPEDIRAAIRCPAESLNVGFGPGTEDQPGLIERIARDAGETGGALPLMQHVLELLWRGMKQRTLAHEAYDDLGGLEGALDQHAEAVFAVLSADEQVAARRLFYKLINLEESGEATRRIATREDLGEDRWRVAEKLAAEDARLLVLRQSAEEAEPDTEAMAAETVEVAHEALLRHWERLLGWIAEDRAFLLWQKRLARQLEDWRRADDKTGLELSGAQLDTAWVYQKTRYDDLDEAERGFIEMSGKVFVEAELEKRSRDQRERRQRDENERQAEKVLMLQRRWLMALAGIVIVLFGAGITGFSLYRAQVVATKIAKESSDKLEIALEAQKLAADAESVARADADAARGKAEDDAARYAAAIAAGLLADGKTIEAIKVVRESLGVKATPEDIARKPAAYSLLAQALGKLEQDAGILRGHEAPVAAASFSFDGTRIVTGSEDRTARVWDAVTGSLLHVLEGHEAEISSASFSRDGTRIVTGSDDNTARIWNAGTGDLMQVLEGYKGKIFAASFSPDGTRIVTVSEHGTARIWNAATGGLLHMLEGQGNRVFYNVFTASFSEDGTRIVVSSGDKTAQIWDAGTGGLLHVLEGHQGLVSTASFSPDGMHVVTGSFDRTARIWDARTGGLVKVLDGHEGTIFAASFSLDGMRVVTGSEDGTAGIWDTEGGGLLHVLEGHRSKIASASFSRDGTRVLTGSIDRTARVWDAGTGGLLHVLEGHEGRISTASFSPDGRRVLTGSEDRTAGLWDAGTGGLLHVLEGLKSRVSVALFSPDGARVLTGGERRVAAIWDGETGGLVHMLEGHKGRISAASFSRDGTRVVTGSEDRTVRVWDAGTGGLLHLLDGHEGKISAASFSLDGMRIVTGSEDNTARIWDAGTGSLLHVLEGHKGRVFAASFSPDGTRIVTGDGRRFARVWDAGTGNFLHVLAGHRSRVFTASFSPDGTRILTGSGDKTARIWDAGTGDLVHVLEGHEGYIPVASFSRDGSRILTGSIDKTARVWDAATGGLMHVLEGHESRILAASFSRDGTRIVTASGDKTARVWDAATGGLAHVLEGHKSRIYTTSFSPDGTRVVTGSDDKTARVWKISPRLYSISTDGSNAWKAHAPFSQALLDRTDKVMPGKLSENERREILKEK